MEQTNSDQRREGKGDNGGKKEKGLDKEHVCMTHGHGQWCGDLLWEQGEGCMKEDTGGNWDNYNRTTINKFYEKHRKRKNKAVFIVLWKKKEWLYSES